MLCVSVAASALRGPSAHAAVPTTAHATVCDVKTCGATGDGHTLDTAALQLAIDHVSQIGGGTIDVPPGHYLTGTLILRDHTTLHLAAGAMLIGSTDIADYRNGADVGQPLPTSPYAQDESAFKALLLAVNAHDIAVTGDGTIDGRGAAVAAAIHQLQVEQKIPGNPKARPDESLRPRILNFVSCRNVRVAGVTLRDSACWVQNYTNCNGLTVDHVTVRSQAFWNNDGIDLTGCQHVRATHLDIDAADDGICLKSNATPCDDLLIQHCKVRSWANAIKFGNVSFQAFRHVTIDHVDVTGSGHAGLSIESVDGAIVDGITVSNVTLRNLRAGILIKLGDRHAPNGQTGAIRNVTLTHVTAELADGDPDAGQTFHAPVPSYKHNPFPCVISGLPDHPIENVVLRDVTFHTPGGGTAAVASVPLDQLQGIRENSKGYPEYSMHGELPAFGWFVRHAAAVTMGDVQVRCGQPDFRSAVVFDDVSALDVSALRITNPGGEGPVVALNRVHGATIRGDVATTTATAYLKSLTDCTAVTAADNVLHPTRAQGAAHGGTPE
jgi:polygalacturonase